MGKYLSFSFSLLFFFFFFSFLYPILFQSSHSSSLRILIDDICSARGEYDTYLACIDSLGEAMLFLTNNKTFKSAEKAIIQIVSHSLPPPLSSSPFSLFSLFLLIRNTESTFETRTRRVGEYIQITDHETQQPHRPVEAARGPSRSQQAFGYTPLLFPFPLLLVFNDLLLAELVPINAMDELKKIVKRFSMFNHINHLKEYKDKRGKFLVNSMRKLNPDKFSKEAAEG